MGAFVRERRRVRGLGMPVEVLRTMLYDTFTSLFPDAPAEADQVLLIECLKNFPAPDTSAVKRNIELLGGGGFSGDGNNFPAGINERPERGKGAERIVSTDELCKS